MHDVMKARIIASYFSPGGRGGTQRALKLAEQLPAFGVETPVLPP
jgi:hypothetical protein